MDAQDDSLIYRVRWMMNIGLRPKLELLGRGLDAAASFFCILVVVAF